MCHRCNYKKLLENADLKMTPFRESILEVIGNNSRPLNAHEIYDILVRNKPIHRVTVYRTLELLVAKNIVERLSGGGRVFYYGLAPNEHHYPHPHFYCKGCGHMECLSPESVSLDMGSLERTYPGVIEHVEVRVDGVCRNCLKSRPPQANRRYFNAS